MAKNLVELIRELKPRTALFTTYTLSLSFFEAVLLPVLQQVNCKDIAILVDANEAVTSLGEAHVLYAGRRYWVAPVVAPGGGIFHPKLAYLAGGETDVLVIGSGNLTLPGQSRQLETFDAISVSTNPIVFRQFEAMASSLAGKIEGSSKQAADLLREYAIRASIAADESKGSALPFPSAAALVHTLERTASEQFLELWGLAKEQAHAMTVLSPFHTPDAGPVRRLAKQLGVDAPSIGLDAKTLVAPFDAQRLKRNNSLRYVIPKTEGELRRLHGKVFEILSHTSALVATGSINATETSLESTKNVEVSLVRWLPSACFDWIEVTPQQFLPNRLVFDSREENFAFLSATLDSDGTVRGKLFRGKEMPQGATAKILRADVSLEEQTRDIVIAGDGAFAFGPIDEVACDSAIQLELSAPSLRATCWLNIVEELAATDDEYRDRRCVRHILRGEFQSEDVAALLQMLCRAALNPAPSKSAELATDRSKIADPSPADSDNRPFSYLQWQMSGRNRHGQGPLRSRADDMLRAFVQWLNGDQKGSKTPVDDKPNPPLPRVPGFRDLSEEGSSKERTDINELLLQLIDAIPRRLDQQPDAGDADILASVSGAYALRQMLQSRWVTIDRLGPVMTWLDRFSRFAYSDSGRQALQPIALGIAMVAAATATSRQLVVPASSLKESLLRFGLGELNADEWKEKLNRALAGETFSQVDEQLLSLAPDMCNEIWQAESVEDWLLRMVRASRGSGKIEPEDEAMFPNVFARLKAMRSVRGKRSQDGVLTSERDLRKGRGCPHCGKAFDEATRKILLLKHVAVCSNWTCRKVVFYLETGAIAEQIKEVLTNA